MGIPSIPCRLKLPGVFVLPKIAKGVEGGGDLSVRTLVCSTIAVGYWTLVGGSNTMKNTMTLSPLEMESHLSIREGSAKIF